MIDDDPSLMLSVMGTRVQQHLSCYTTVLKAHQILWPTVGSTFVLGAVDCCYTSFTNGVESEVLGLTGLSCSVAVVVDDKCSDGSADEVDGGKRGLILCSFRLIRRLLSAFTI